VPERSATPPGWGSIADTPPGAALRWPPPPCVASLLFPAPLRGDRFSKPSLAYEAP